MRDIIILGIGVAVGYYLVKDIKSNASVVKPGNKSQAIEGMQKTFEKMAGLKFEEYGNYDSDTLAASQYLLAGTKGMVDQSKGYINSELVSDLAKINSNSLNN